MSNTSWREDFKETGFTYAETFIDVNPDTSLFITHCCKEKNKNLTKGLAKDLYIGNRNQRFYKYVISRQYKYCTVSDKYGLVFPHQIIETYDTAPSDLTLEDVSKLKLKIKSQIPEDINTIIYYCQSPLMAKFYLKLFLEITYLNKYFISSFKYVDKIRKFDLF